MGMWNDFKAFAFKTSVIDLAVALIIGTAFTKIINALVEDLVMPLLGKVLPTGSYQTWAPHGIKLGLLLGAMIDFAIIAFVLFLVIRWMKRHRLG